MPKEVITSLQETSEMPINTSTVTAPGEVARLSTELNTLKEKPINENTLEMYHLLQTEITKGVHEGLIFEVAQANLLDPEFKTELDTKERARELAFRSLQPAVLNTLHQNKLPEEGDYLEIKIPGKPRAVAIEVSLKPLENDPEALEQTRQYINNNLEGCNLQTTREAFEYLQRFISNTLVERLTAEDLGGLISSRSEGRFTGVVGNPEDKDPEYTERQINSMLQKISMIIQRVSNTPIPEKSVAQYVKVFISESEQKATIAKVGPHYITDYPATRGESPLILVNNALSANTPIESPIVRVGIHLAKGTTIENTKKGTSYQILELDPTATINQMSLFWEKPRDYIPQQEMSNLMRHNVDQFINPHALAKYLERNPDKLNQLKGIEGRTEIELQDSSQNKTQLEIENNNPEGVIAKGDISGFSKLTRYMEQYLKIPVQEITYPIFAKVSYLAQKCGAIFDNFSGDAQETCVLSMEAVKEFELEENMYELFKNFNAAERSVLFAIGTRAIFEKQIRDWKKAALEQGSTYDLDIPSILSGDSSLEQIHTQIETLYARKAHGEIQDIINGVALILAEANMHSELGMKVIGNSTKSGKLVLKVVGEQVIQELEHSGSLESTMENVSKQYAGRYVVTPEVYTRFREESGFKEAFEQVKQGNGILYVLKKDVEESLKQAFMSEILA